MIRDMYDALPPERGRELRRKNKERLAELERKGHKRRERLVSVIVQFSTLDEFVFENGRIRAR